MTPTVRVLLLADTHLGFDDPLRPRVARRRRGPDFFACYEKALEPALRGEVDLVVHGGDLLFRARVPASLVQRAMAPLFAVADRGVPVFVVPGNHERSRIPYPLLTYHPHVHVFHAPRTVSVTVGAGALRVAVSGFPFVRRIDGRAFTDVVERTGWREHAADVRLLCMHQSVEGATVGVQHFTFRRGADVVPGHAIPPHFAAVLSGHIHRSQVLVSDLAWQPLAAPVCYPGSIERTSFAERNETKGYLLLEMTGGPAGGRLVDWDFVPLPARPMRVIEIDAGGLTAETVERQLRAHLRVMERDAVVRVAPGGTLLADAQRVLCAAGLRSIAPATMSIGLAPPRAERRQRGARRATR